MSVVFTELASPIGPLRLAARDGALIRLALGDDGPPPADWRRDDDALAPASAQLRAYLAGERQTFALPLAPTGSEFQRRVWHALTQIPYGETISYGELARRVGQPDAARAVGMANNRNPIAIVVPCHRVVGADGRLVGFGGGLPRKQWLLQHEAAHREFKLTSPPLVSTAAIGQGR
ncbi:MAG: methylated-DNA--[protein]-cysteine S-methyltransferase [Myxococcales bacterium]|nr:methylated-DNA--[protein]-cysteine S-methyltransferase [Myxococcales bacterium]